MDIHDTKDFRNNKVKWDKAKTYLGFHEQYTLNDIVLVYLNIKKTLKIMIKESFTILKCLSN